MKTDMLHKVDNYGLHVISKELRILLQASQQSQYSEKGWIAASYAK